MWRRHRHPASGWTRTLLGVPLAVGIWLHAWWLIALSALLTATNPFWFPEPKPDAASFMTRVVDGERAWLKRAGLAERLTVSLTGGLLLAGLVYALWMNLPGWSLFLGACTLCLKCCHIVWMAGYGREDKA